MPATRLADGWEEPLVIEVISKLKAQPGKEDDVRRALEEMVNSSRDKDPQAIGYGVHVSDEDPTEFLVMERHTSVEERLPDGQSESMLRVGVALRESLREPIEIVGRYSVLAEIGGPAGDR